MKEAATITRPKWTETKGHSDGLLGLWGKLRLAPSGSTVGVLKVEDGQVQIDPHGEASITLGTDTESTLIELLSGKLHPVVARLQGRAWFEGDPTLGLRMLLGLRASSPWRADGAGS
jgi:hypothetical protein